MKRAHNQIVKLLWVASIRAKASGTGLMVHLEFMSFSGIPDLMTA